MEQRRSMKFYMGIALMAALIAIVGLLATAAHVDCRVSDPTPQPGR